MNAIGAVEVLMPALVENEYLEKTGRLEVDVGFDVVGKGEDKARYVLGWTHEEIITDIASKYVQSYKDLPFGAYQIQTKFRNEKRAKSGLLRGREFTMKDLYSFHATEQDLFEYYEQVRRAYNAIFERCGLESYYTLADGGDFHHKQHARVSSCCRRGRRHNFLLQQMQNRSKRRGCRADPYTMRRVRGRDTKQHRLLRWAIYSRLAQSTQKNLDLCTRTKKTSKNRVYMGSYGIGVGRLDGDHCRSCKQRQGRCVEQRGCAVFRAHSCVWRASDRTKQPISTTTYKVEGLKFCWTTETDASPGEKLADADLIGAPTRIVVSQKTQEQNGYGVKTARQTRRTNCFTRKTLQDVRSVMVSTLFLESRVNFANECLNFAQQLIIA